MLIGEMCLIKGEYGTMVPATRSKVVGEKKVAQEKVSSNLLVKLSIKY